METWTINTILVLLKYLSVILIRLGISNGPNSQVQIITRKEPVLQLVVMAPSMSLDPQVAISMVKPIEELVMPLSPSLMPVERSNGPNSQAQLVSTLDMVSQPEVMARSMSLDPPAAIQTVKPIVVLMPPLSVNLMPMETKSGPNSQGQMIPTVEKPSPLEVMARSMSLAIQTAISMVKAIVVVGMPLLSN